MSQDYFTGDVVKDSQYSEAFRRLAASGTLTLTGDTVLVEKLGKIESKTAGGIILPTDGPSSYKHQTKDDVLEFGVILMTGPGDISSEGDRLPMDVKVGDIIALPMNVQWYSQFGHLAPYKINTIGRMRAAQVMMKFTDYKAAMEALNATQDKV